MTPPKLVIYAPSSGFLRQHRVWNLPQTTDELGNTETAMHPQTFTVRLDVRQRSDYLSARCAEVPGLFISGATPEDLRSRAMPAIKRLMKANRQLDVDVLPTDDLAELKIRVRSA